MILASLKLIRLPNLLIAIGSQWVAYDYFIRRALENNQIDTEPSTFAIFGLMLCTFLVMAGGNVINDIVDQAADQINKPDDRLVGRSIGERTAIIIYGALNLIAILTAICLSFLLQHVRILALTIVCSFLLLWYSQHLQFRPLLGNLLVGLLCGVSLWSVPWVLSEDIYLLKDQAPSVYFHSIRYFLYFGYFAMLVNILREVVKDAEDVEGDRQTGSHTWAVDYQEKGVKIWGLVVSCLLFILLVWMTIGNRDWLGNRGWEYFVSLLLVLILIMIYLLRAQVKDEYRKLGFWIKVFMVQGIFYIIFWHV